MVWSGMPPVRTARSFLSGKSGHMDGGLSGFCAYNLLSPFPSLRLRVYQVCHGSAAQLTNERLAKALSKKTDFTQAEWDAFGITGLQKERTNP